MNDLVPIGLLHTKQTKHTVYVLNQIEVNHKSTIHNIPKIIFKTSFRLKGAFAAFYFIFEKLRFDLLINARREVLELRYEFHKLGERKQELQKIQVLALM